MPKQSSEKHSVQVWPLQFAGIAAFLTAAGMIIAPRKTPILLLLFIAAPLVWAYIAGSGRLKVTMKPLLASLLVFGGYLLVNSSWSVAPREAYGKVALYFAILAGVTLAAAAMQQADRIVISRMNRAVIIAAVLAGAFICLEVLLKQPMLRTLYSIFPFMEASQKHMTVEDGWVERIGSYTLNRNMGTLTLLFWPALLIIANALSQARAQLAGWGLTAIAAVAVLFSEHETSVLALAFSALIFVIARQWPRLGERLTSLGWLSATLLVVPIAMAAYSQQLHMAKWIPDTGRARIILWDYTAQQVKKKPFLGVGVESTKPLDYARRKSAEKPDGFVYPRRTGRHSHNIYMQTWYELGAIGAILLAACGMVLLSHIRAMPYDVKPYALAGFVAAAVTGAFSWGIWQPWFMAAYGLSALLFVLAVETAARRRPVFGQPVD